MANPTVGTTAVPIANRGPQTLFVTNLGPNRLWYGSDISVGKGIGIPLDPGNAIQGYPVGNDLFVASEGLSQLAYDNNGSSVAIGAVALNGPVAAKSSNAPVLLQTLTRSYPSATTSGTSITSSLMDVSSFASVSIIPYVSQGTFWGLTPTCWAVVELQWITFFAGIERVLISDKAEWTGYDSAGAPYLGSFQVPTRASFLRVRITVTHSSSGQAGAFSTDISGSNETIANRKYRQIGQIGSAFDWTGNDLDTGGAYQNSQAVSSTTAVLLSSVNGPASLQVHTAAGAGGLVTLEYFESGAYIRMAQSGTVAASSHFDTSLYLPCRPIRITNQNTGTSGIMYTSLTQ